MTNGTLEAVFDKHEEPIEKLRVAYRSPSGEITYRIFRLVDTEPPISATGREDDAAKTWTSPKIPTYHAKAELLEHYSSLKSEV